MGKSLTFEPSVDNAESFRKFLQQGLAEMDRNFELMARDQVEIDRLAVSTAKTLAEIHALSEQTDAILATLKVK